MWSLLILSFVQINVKLAVGNLFGKNSDNFQFHVDINYLKSHSVKNAQGRESKVMQIGEIKKKRAQNI